MNELATQTVDDVAEQLAEHQLDWDRIRDRLTTLGPDHPPESLGPFLTISRQAGTDGDAIARRVGDALEWAVLNGEIVDLMAELFDLEPHMLRLVDEARASWVSDVVTDLLPLKVIDRDTYVHHLGRVFHVAALHGEVVLVGRGANLFLPRKRGLSVRLVGDEKQRIAHLGNREGLDQQRAKRLVDDLDHRRARLVRHYFGRDIDDPLLYDLVLNTTSVPGEDIAEIIVDTCRARGLDR